jgi:hypothetical protein
MNVRRPIFSGIALCTSLLFSVPADVVAQTAVAAQSAGKITTVLPIVNVVRGPQMIPASASQEVFWGDVVNTGHLARARVALNDGSVLSVGSDSNLAISKHDAAEQQTDLELNYGRVRANAVKLVKPKANFQIRTSSGVAGVVGTDFEVSTENDTTRIVVFDGKVKFCALVSEEKKRDEEEPGIDSGIPAPNVQDDQDQNKRKRRVFLGPCVVVAAGATSDVHFNSAPSQPVPATPLTVSDAVNATSPTGSGAGAGGGAAGGGAGAGGAAGGGIGAAGGAIAGVSAAVAAAVATAVVRSVATTKTCAPPPTGGAAPRANCVSRTGVNRLPGQR